MLRNLENEVNRNVQMLEMIKITNVYNYME